ncbi:AMP phosphorylase [Candidatus Micrarchaeota archaeon]|nr:AMP phosphorylase [Candidatus Micrarchaeota archaeon]
MRVLSMAEFREKEMKKVDVWKLKKYVCKVKRMDIYAGKPIVILNKEEAKEHDIYAGYRTKLNFDSKSDVAIVDVSGELIRPGEVGIYNDIADEFNLQNGDTVHIEHLDRPESITHIKKKLDKGTLREKEVKTIVTDIMKDRLSDVETSAWITAAYINGLSDEEIVALAHATVESGDRLDLGKKPVLDKHCIGGVAGNRTTMLIVPIIAAAGLYIPKTSSRSITSASGTADTMEVLANVTFNMDELKEMVLKARGAMVWGGGMALAPVDDKLIRVRHPLSLDPEGMLLASILGKKKSVGSQYVLIDVPVGRGVKVPYIEKGHHLAKHFIEVGEKMGMSIEALITDGAEPVGHGVGPALECIDVLDALDGKGPSDLRHKSVLMAGKLLELCGKADRGGGYNAAQNILDSGKAMKKFREIIELQEGDPKVKTSDIEVGPHEFSYESDVGGSIFHIDNKTVSKIARIAGSPRDKGAGVLLHKFRGDKVQKGEKVFTVYAESAAKLKFAEEALEKLEPVEMRKILLGSMK